MRLVCLGDSFTEGLCDQTRPDGQYLGWADRVAAGLPGTVTYANLAVRGKLLDQVVSEQIPAAQALTPDVLTFHAGGNDVLRRSTDPKDLFARYDAAVARLVAPQRRVLVFTSLSRTGGTGRLANAIALRFAAFNHNVRRVAARRGAEVVDLDAVPALSDRRLWNDDRLHLNPQGHARVAAQVLETLGIDSDDSGWWRQPLPPRTSARRRDELAADLAWARNHFAPWVWRRVRGTSSGDGITAKDPVLREVE